MREQGRPIDLLPDRRAETVSAWLQAHPHIDIVSRDGSLEYASVQMEDELCHFKKKYLPLFALYCQKNGYSDDQFGRDTCRNSELGSNTLPSFGADDFALM
jgi:hypothetical protein